MKCFTVFAWCGIVCLDASHNLLALVLQTSKDIMAAAGGPLESALAVRLNDLLWDVEKRSIDESMDE